MSSSIATRKEGDNLVLDFGMEFPKPGGDDSRLPGFTIWPPAIENSNAEASWTPGHIVVTIHVQVQRPFNWIEACNISFAATHIYSAYASSNDGSTLGPDFQAKLQRIVEQWPFARRCYLSSTSASFPDFGEAIVSTFLQIQFAFHSHGYSTKPLSPDLSKQQIFGTLKDALKAAKRPGEFRQLVKDIAADIFYDWFKITRKNKEKDSQIDNSEKQSFAGSSKEKGSLLQRHRTVPWTRRSRRSRRDYQRLA